MPSPDGPPYRSGVIFRRNRTVNINWTDGSRHTQHVFMAQPQKKARFWKIARVEFDVAGNIAFSMITAARNVAESLVLALPCDHASLRPSR